MPVESDPKDLVSSPTPAADPSPAAPTPPVATPEPSSGAPAAPPAASDKALATPPAAPATTEPTIKPLGDGDALDRLTSPTEKPKENTPAPVDAPAAKAAEPDTENKDAPPEPAEGEDVPFKDADEKELAGYHSRTRHRIKQYQTEVNRLRGPAKFTYDLAQAAAQRELKFESVVKWQELGFGLRDGDPEAIEALAAIVDSHYKVHGKKFATEVVVPDVAPVEAAINAAFQSLDINEAAKNQLLAAVAKLKTPPVAQPVQQPRPQPVQQPQRPQPTEMDRTRAYVHNEKAKLAQQVGAAKFQAVYDEILAEAKRREAVLPPHLIDDPIELRIRFAACKEYVLAKVSQQAAAKATPTVPVQPSLRATPSPTPIPVPQRGTPEYDDYVLTHGVPQR